MRSFKLGTAGMRGIVGTGLTVERAIDFASAVGTLLDGGRVVLGCDTRFSTNMLRYAVTAALTGCGCEVLNAGIAPAGLIHFLTPHLNADGALLLGAGHQNAGWNAAIPLASKGNYFNRIELQELLDIYHSHRYRSVPWNKIEKVQAVPENVVDEYLDALCRVIDARAIENANFTVVADFCNGSGGAVAERVAERLGVKMIGINKIFSGILPHEPEPRPRTASQVQSLIAPLGADAGFVFNSDASRLAIVTNTAETLSEEYTAPLAADYLISGCSDARVVTNICSTRALDDVVAKHGGNLYKTRVGQAHVIDKMFETGAQVACEGSGSLTSSKWVCGFDALYVMAVILEYMAVTGRELSDLASEIPRYHIVKSTVRCQSSQAYAMLRNMRGLAGDATVTEDDGTRIDWDDGWVSVRSSTTEAVIRMISESKTIEKAVDRDFQLRGMIEHQRCEL